MICCGAMKALNDQDWTREYAIAEAGAVQIILEPFDWAVIEFVRAFYQEHEIMPLTRRIIKFIRENLKSDFDSIAFQVRYSAQPLFVIARISGLPRPMQCI